MRRRSRARHATVCVVTLAAACSGTSARESAPEEVATHGAAAASARPHIATPPLYKGDALRRDENGACWFFQYEVPTPETRHNPPPPMRLGQCPSELGNGIASLRRDRSSGTCTLLLTTACPPTEVCPPATPRHVACPDGSPDGFRPVDADDAVDEAAVDRARGESARRVDGTDP